MVHGNFLTASLIAKFAYHNGPWEFSHCIRRARLVSHRQFRSPERSMGVFSLHQTCQVGISSTSSPTPMAHGSFLTASDVLGWCVIVRFAYHIGPWEFTHCISHRQFRHNGPWEFSHCIRRVRLVSHRQFRLPNCAFQRCDLFSELRSLAVQSVDGTVQTLDHQASVFQIRVLRFPLLRQLLRLGGQARYLRICLCQREIVLLQLPNCSWLEFCSPSSATVEVSDVTSLTLFLISSSLNSFSQVGGLRTLQDCRRLSCEQLRVEIVDCTSSTWTTPHRDLWSWLVDSAAARSLSQISRLLLRHLLPTILIAAGRRDLLVQVLNLTDQLCPGRLEVRLRLERPVELLDRWHIPVALFPTEDLPPLFVGSSNAHARLALRRSREMRQLVACNFCRRWTTLSICAGPSAPDAAALFRAITPRNDLAACRAHQFFPNTYDVPEARIKHSWLGAPCCTHIKLRTKQVKTTTVCQVDLRLGACASA